MISNADEWRLFKLNTWRRDLIYQAITCDQECLLHLRQSTFDSFTVFTDWAVTANHHSARRYWLQLCEIQEAVESLYFPQRQEACFI